MSRRSVGGTGTSEASWHELSLFLTELDGCPLPHFLRSGDVYVIGGTNRPDILSRALLRAGRFYVRAGLPLRERFGLGTAGQPSGHSCASSTVILRSISHASRRNALPARPERSCIREFRHWIPPNHRFITLSRQEHAYSVRSPYRDATVYFASQHSPLA